MRRLAAGAAILALALLVAPEFPRYAAERHIGFATAAFQALLDARNDPATPARIRAVGELALANADRLPGDPRAWILAASSHLVTGDPEKALDYYRSALDTGERAEIDLNLGRAYAMLSRAESADAAFLRAGWVNPEILRGIPEDRKAKLDAEIARLSGELRAGRLDAPPPLPQDDRR